MLFTMIHVQAAVVYLFLSISLFSISPIHATNVTDRMALLAFKHSILQDPQRALSSWNDSFHFCQWEGVTCGRRHHQRVTTLVLKSRGLTGPLSPYVGNLSFLRVLKIYNNTFNGEIPPQLGHLFRLQKLNLNDNNFEGRIPNSIGLLKNLLVLALGHNKLSGMITPAVYNLSSLVVLHLMSNQLQGSLLPSIGLMLPHLQLFELAENQFTGCLPHSLSNCSDLENIYVWRNSFSGHIPDSIGLLKKLEDLELDTNNLSGMIPPSFYNLSLLSFITLSKNQFQGSLLPSIGSMLPRLRYFLAFENEFSGPLPLSFSNCSELYSLELTGNYFDGKIAIDFGGLRNLKQLTLGYNNLGSGEPDELNFMGSVVNCSNLEVFELEGNKLRGLLPDFVGNLSSQLKFLQLAHNQLYGRLPSTIGNLVGLNSLVLTANEFSGTIPTSIGNFGKLGRMYLAKNKFSGAIPDSIGNLSMLIELDLEVNQLEGRIPESLGNCQSLSILTLSHNNLSGPIPKQLFSLSALSFLLNLSGNHLHGSLPSEVSNLKNLGILDLSKNDLSGGIPISLDSCTSLEFLLLHQNVFQGFIPSSLSSLKGLKYLDLSHNNFSGRIPRFFEQFSMEYLNLSFNNFEGEVPMRGVFANQSGISVVGNKKLCGGMYELHLPKCSTEKSKKRRGRSRVLIIVISTTCTLFCVTIMLSFLFCWHTKKRKVKSSGPLLKEPFIKVSYEMLLKATDGFSSENLVGKGSFGSVYKGILDVDELGIVSIKVLNLESRGASKSFMAECEALRSVRHRNLLRIITACSSIDFQGNDFKALVYDFMPNGSLEKWLHSNPEAQNERDDRYRLGLLQRINIAIDVACALDYLHHNCEKPIIHCDLKPSNILLDRDMVAHVGDFGLAKFLLPELTDAIQSSSIGLKGTIGYAAPEYGLGSEISTNGDVYSFGILLLEMIIGKRPTDIMFKDGLNLHNFAAMALPEHVKDIVDPLILANNEEAITEAVENNSRGLTRANITEECLVSAIKIGVACSVESPQSRMSITNVLRELNLVRKIILQQL